jgi:hypothetical protein
MIDFRWVTFAQLYYSYKSSASKIKKQKELQTSYKLVTKIELQT